MPNEVKIKVVADSKQATQNLEGLRGAIDKVRQHARAAGVAMTAFGAATTAALGFSIKQFAEMGDEVQKMALRTGFSTESLSELRFAAQIAGTEITSLEKGVRRMAKAITDGSEGLAESVRAFDRLGISVSDLVGLKPEEQFFKIIAALGDMTDASEKATTAQDIFGRAGTQLLPLVAAGAKGIEELREQARDLGMAFHQEASEKAAEFQDALTTLKAGVTGIALEIGGTLAPSLSNLARNVTEVVKTVREWIHKHPALTKAIIGLTAVVGGLAVTLGPLLVMLPAIVALGPAVAGAFSMMLGPVGLLTAGLTALGAAFGYALLQSSAATKADIEARLAPLQEAAQQMRRTIAAIEEAGREVPDFLRKRLRAYEAEIGPLLDQLNKFLSIEEAQKQAEELSAQATDTLATATDGLSSSTEDVNKKIATQWATYHKLNAELTGVRARLDDIATGQQAVRDAAEATDRWWATTHKLNAELTGVAQKLQASPTLAQWRDIGRSLNTALAEETARRASLATVAEHLNLIKDATLRLIQQEDNSRMALVTGIWDEVDAVNALSGARQNLQRLYFPEGFDPNKDVFGYAGTAFGRPIHYDEQGRPYYDINERSRGLPMTVSEGFGEPQRTTGLSSDSKVVVHVDVDGQSMMSILGNIVAADEEVRG